MTERITHVALGDPGGPSHPGDEFDCPQCRAALLEAFRTPADRYREYFGSQPIDPGSRPHLMLPPGRTVAIPPTEPDEPSNHVTWGQAVPNGPGVPGGRWEAGCSCGWRKGGTYARDGVGESVAGRLAQTWAAQHLADPLGEER